MALTGLIRLKDGTRIELTEDLLAAAPTISMSTCSGTSFDVGTFNAGMLKIALYDDEAKEHEFDGAIIKLTLTGGTEEEPTELPLGLYHVDGNRIARRKNKVALTAQDSSLMFDIELPETLKSGSYTAFNALTVLCSFAGVALYNADLSEFPNSDVLVAFDSGSIQTARDAVMWIAQLICANAVINRNNQLEMRRARYVSEGGAGSEIIANYESNGSDRVSIAFSDVRIFTKYLSSYSAGKPKDYESSIVPSDAQARQGSLSLLSNPLFSGKTESECDAINTAWLDYFDGFAPRNIKAQLFSHPEIKLGDTIRFSGGLVDIRRRIIGVVTSIKWTYRGYTMITCAAPKAVQE